MSEHPTEPCRSCAAPIIWASSETTLKPMPVNAEPSKDGTVQLIKRDGEAPIARVLKVAQRFGRKDLRLSHFADCPDAPQWRARRSGRGA
nr:hypothetical protein [Micromonospora sp. DSM 115978]